MKKLITVLIACFMLTIDFFTISNAVIRYRYAAEEKREYEEMLEEYEESETSEDDTEVTSEDASEDEDVNQIIEEYYNTAQDYYNQGDYYNAIMTIREAYEVEDAQKADAFKGMSDLYDTCYSEMKSAYLEAMEEFYFDTYESSYDSYRGELQEVYGKDSGAVDEINAAIKDFSQVYLVSVEHDITDGNEDGVYEYEYDDENKSVLFDGSGIRFDFRHPEITYLYTGYEDLYFFNPGLLMTNYTRCNFRNEIIELGYESGKITYCICYSNESTIDEKYQFVYDDEGKCNSYGFDDVEVEITYDDSGRVSNLYIYTMGMESSDYCENLNYHYDDKDRLASIDGNDYGTECSSKFVYDDDNRIVYYYRDSDSDSPYATMYYDENWLCYKIHYQFNGGSYMETTYEYAPHSANLDFFGELFLNYDGDN
jgi:hypothetical protein